jgi:hypothetical protein
LSYNISLAHNLNFANELELKEPNNKEWNEEDVETLAKYLKDNSLPKDTERLRGLRRIIVSVCGETLLAQFDSVDSRDFPELASSRFLESIGNAKNLQTEFLLEHLDHLQSEHTIASFEFEDLVSIFSRICESLSVRDQFLFVQRACKHRGFLALFLCSCISLPEGKPNEEMQKTLTESASLLESTNKELFQLHRLLLNSALEENRAQREIIANQQKSESAKDGEIGKLRRESAGQQSAIESHLQTLQKNAQQIEVQSRTIEEKSEEIKSLKERIVDGEKRIEKKTQEAEAEKEKSKNLLQTMKT